MSKPYYVGVVGVVTDMLVFLVFCLRITTMSEERNYTVYMHICPNNKKYIGVTGKTVKKRWINGLGYKGQVFYNAIKKYGWDNIKHVIIAEHLTRKEAFNAEIDWIKYWDTTNNKNGYNISKGGENPHSGIPCTEKQKKARSIPVIQYSVNGKTIKKWDSASKVERVLGYDHSTISAACKGKVITAYGYTWGYADGSTIQKVRYKKPYKEKPVIIKPKEVKPKRYNYIYEFTINGMFVAKYKNLIEASNNSNCSIPRISNSCKHHGVHTKGSIWFRCTDTLFKKYPLGSKELINYIKTNNDLNRFYKVVQYSLDGTYIKTWKNVSEIIKDKRFKSSNIHKTCRGLQETAYNFIWRYEGSDLKVLPQEQLFGKKISQYTIDGKLIKIWDSSSTASKELNYDVSSIVHCCRGRNNTAYGYLWKYSK